MQDPIQFFSYLLYYAAKNIIFDFQHLLFLSHQKLVESYFD